MRTVTCGRCGVQDEAEDEGIPLGWSFNVEDGRMVHLCTACVRANIRAIESKLPQEWWE